jgi:hypothetical protein
MKYLNFLIVVLVLTINSTGQDITIPDYKGDRESLSGVKDKIIRREVASFTEAGAEEPKSNIHLKEIPLVNSGTNYSTFKKDSVSVRINIGKFIKANHKINYIDSYAVKIDNKPIWGTDGELPKTQINSIKVQIGVDTVTIPRSAFHDLFEPSLSWKEGTKTVGGLSVYYSSDKRRFYIAMSNSDGAGFYEATLIIKDKKYYRRIMDYGF